MKNRLAIALYLFLLQSRINKLISDVVPHNWCHFISYSRLWWSRCNLEIFFFKHSVLYNIYWSFGCVSRFLCWQWIRSFPIQFRLVDRSNGSPGNCVERHICRLWLRWSLQKGVQSNTPEELNSLECVVHLIESRITNSVTYPMRCKVLIPNSWS